MLKFKSSNARRDYMTEEDPQRGTGRTKAMVKSLPDAPCIVVVHSHGFIWYVKRMIADLRGPDVLAKVRFVSLSNVNALRGLRLPIFVDHFVHDHAFQNHMRYEYSVLHNELELNRIRGTK